MEKQPKHRKRPGCGYKLYHLLEFQEFQTMIILFAFTSLSAVTYFYFPSYRIAAGIVFAVGLAATKYRSMGGHFSYREDLSGKVAIVTGGNVGLGLESASRLAEWGATVVIACRSVEKGQEALQQIIKDSGSDKLELMQLDLASFKSVRKFADEFKKKHNRLDILLNNAGVMQTPYMLTEDGFEMQFGTNHLGHYLLTVLLLPLIVKTGPGRIVNVSSLAHAFVAKPGLEWESQLDPDQYESGYAYGQSKLANILFTAELQRRLKEAGSGVTTYAAHPGAVRTDLIRHYSSVAQTAMRVFQAALFKNVAQGAQTQLFCCIDPSANPGGYHADAQPTRCTEFGQDQVKARELWDYSARVTGANWP